MLMSEYDSGLLFYVYFVGQNLYGDVKELSCSFLCYNGKIFIKLYLSFLCFKTKI
jgi:hypothetical protein